MLLVNEGHRERGRAWREQTLHVDPNPPETLPRWERFTGRLLSQITARTSPGDVEMRDGFYILYETPCEGYKLFAKESVIEGTDDVRQPGHRAAAGQTTRALYSEEEARQRYPTIFEQLLDQAQEELGR